MTIALLLNAASRGARNPASQLGTASLLITTSRKKATFHTTKIPQVAINEFLQEAHKLTSSPVELPLRKAQEAQSIDRMKKFLRQEPSCKELQESLDALQQQKIHGIYFENSIPPLEFDPANVIIKKSNIAHDQNSKTNSEELQTQIIKRNIPNILFVTTFFSEIGCKPFHNPLHLQSTPAFFALSKTTTQGPHTDGAHDDQIKIGCLNAIKSNGEVATTFIAVEDIIKKLSTKTIEILQKPIAIYQLALLTKDENNKFAIFYKDSLITDLIASNNANIETPTKLALSELQTAIISSMEEEATRFNLSTGQQLAFDNLNVVHRRENTLGNAAPRFVIATPFQQDKQHSK